jgi:hydroxymethylpyrimidine/phosphomethylpyrimidine kinase
MNYKCLSIAGFDGSAGAGLQADLKTFSALGCYGMTVLTALPIQNTQGVKNCYDLPLPSIEEQLETIFEDIIPDAIKIGMLFSSDIVDLIASFLKQHASKIPIVLDPVMIAKSGDTLLQETAIHTLKTKLIPLVTLITPNLPEAYALVGKTDSLENLAKELLQLGSKAVFLKGGHAQNRDEANDLLLSHPEDLTWFKSPRIVSKNTHGTGCTLSAAICACLARGFSLEKACAIAKNYLFNTLKAAQNNSVGKGNGPVHHFYHLEPQIKHTILELSNF